MRTHRFVFVLTATAALLVTPRARAFEEGDVRAESAGGPRIGAEETAPTRVEAAAELEAIIEAYEEDEEHYEEEAEFCGGGEESTFMLAWYEYEAQSYESARAMLVDGIKYGSIDPWDRGNALALLGEVQVRMSDFRPAVHNFRRALEVDPSLEQGGVRIGYAVALHGIGRSNEALDVARAHAAETCANGAVSADCYGAFLLVSALTDDATEMFEAMRSAGAIVRGYPEIAEEIGWLAAAIESR